MAQGAWEGVAEGIGQGLGQIGAQLRENNIVKIKTRDQQADDLTSQIKSIADNIAKVGGKDAPEAAPLIEQLKSTIDRHNALYPAHETPALLARLKGLMGHKPGAAQPDVRSGMTPEGMMAAAPMPTNNILQEVNNLMQVYVKGGDTPEDARQKALKAISAKYKTEDTYTVAPGEAGKPYQDKATGKWFQLQYDKSGQNRPVELPEGYEPDEGWKPQDGDVGKPYKGADGKIYQNQVNKYGKTRSQELVGMTEDSLRNKALKPNINSATGGLDSIEDPNSGKLYTASDIDTAPPDVQKTWTDITGQVEKQVAYKEEQEQKKVAQAEKMLREREDQQNRVQEQSFRNTLDAKDYDLAKKDVNKAEENYQDALDRMATMDRNQKDALKGDQQAMLSLVANHIGMTLGAQKGARITRAAFDEAVQSAPWLSRMGARWSADGYLSGVTLTPDQMQQMVRLAREKVDILKDHKQRIENDLHDALNPRENKGVTKAPGGKTDAVDEQILKLLGGK